MKKYISLLIAAIIVFGMLTAAPFTFSAAQTDGSDPDNMVIKKDRYFYFDADSAYWSGFEDVLYHLYDMDGRSVFSWGCKKAYAYKAGDGIWKVDFDAVALTIDDSRQYALIFYNDKGDRTFPLLFDASCYGATAYCTGACAQAPTDGGQSEQYAFWKGKDSGAYGPVLTVTPLGEVVGTVCPKEKTPQLLLKEFLGNSLEYARKFSGKDEQTLMDDIIRGLGLDVKDAQSVIEGSEYDICWKPVAEKPFGDADGDGDISSVDVTFIQRHNAMIVTGIDEDTLMNADVDGNGLLEIIDATWIQRYLAYIDTPYGIGK